MALYSSELCKQLNFVQLAKLAKLLKDIGMPLDFVLSSQSTDEICTVVFSFLVCDHIHSSDTNGAANLDLAALLCSV